MADKFFADATIEPVGYRQITNLTAAIGIPIANGRVAVVQALFANVRWRDDGVAPTGTVGIRLHAGETMFYTGNLRSIRFIEEAASAELNITAYQ
jgi:hypothetical protein